MTRRFNDSIYERALKHEMKTGTVQIALILASLKRLHLILI